MEATSILCTIITVLLGANAFFIKRLIDKVDNAADQAKAAGEKAASASSAVAEIKADIKEMRRLEIDVAVMKSALFPRRPPLPPPDEYAKVG